MKAIIAICVGLLLPVQVDASALVTSSSELIGVRFELTPLQSKGERHPTDLKQATNCAGVVIYGLRQTARSLPYMSAKGLRLYMQERNWQLKRAVKIQSGDILHFGSQTAMIAEDNAPLGVLSGDDKILHAFYAPVKIERWKNLPYKNNPYEIYRPE